jgi:anthranilate synthase component 1
VEGEIAPGQTPLDVFRACFPAGTLTGAPKIRAMEIIDELERSRRGVYGGAVGYVAFGGNLDFAIAIRTLVTRGEEVLVQAGAGIVADSDPAAEFDETVAKAKAVARALRMART